MKINPSDYSPPNVNYWGDRCCRVEAEVERLQAKIDASIRVLSDDRLPLQSRVNDARGILAR